VSTQEDDILAVLAFVASAAGVDAGLVWRTNAGPTRPTGGYLTVLDVAEAPIGLPETVTDLVDDVPITVVSQVVEQTWSVMAFGSAAYAWIDAIRRLWRTAAGPAATLTAAGVTPLHANGAVNHTRKIDTAFETRWGVTITSLAVRQTTIGETGEATQIVVDLSLIRAPDIVAATATITYPEEP
jgi:hypothetical protein